ncbi:MAG: hypothetical protein IJ464_01490, partial [Alistipes sp.]|nr:hypothetical protein [Alistipes sp.]
VNGFDINPNGTNTGTALWGNKTSMIPEKLTVIVDGLKWIGGAMYEDENGSTLVYTTEGLKAAISAKKTNIVLQETE